MKKQLLKLLNITPEQYEDQTMNLWAEWCTAKVVNPKKLQKMLICQALFNWWQRELESLEIEFINDMQTSITQLDPEAYLKAYHFTTRRIYERFSKPLIKSAYDS